MNGFNSNYTTITKDPDDVETYGVDLSAWLDDEFVDVVTTELVSNITVQSVAKNTSNVVIDGVEVYSGKGIVFRLSGGAPGVDGRITFRVLTTPSARVRDFSYKIVIKQR